ncbi:MAG: ribonuclease Z [Candidatus Heimdallarchaeota archaeon]|nr:ribonuclease Z [Candidatus Heimdallarchaeota archaeon]
MGTGSAIPPLKRQQSSIALVHQKGTVILDCGEGTQYNMRKFKVSTSKEFIIAITHLHSDHTLGIPGLLSSFQLQGRTDPIRIIGPPGMTAYVQGILQGFMITLEYELEIKEMYPGQAFEGKNYQIIAYESNHAAPGIALSYIWIEKQWPNKFDTDKLDALSIARGPHLKKLQKGETIMYKGKEVKPSDVMFPGRRGRIIAYTGDTSPNPKFMKQLPKDTDVLIHEASFPIDAEELALDRGHSTIMQAASMASKSHTNTLILTHISPRFTPKQLKEDLLLIQKIFPNSIIAKDGFQHIIELPEARK